MYALLWIIAVVLVVWGIVTIARGNLALGIVLIILGLLVGPGGVSIFPGDDDDDRDGSGMLGPQVVTEMSNGDRPTAEFTLSAGLS
jgi:hypothetical protein